MIAKQGAGEHGGNGDGLRHTEAVGHIDAQRQQDSHGAPAGAGGKGDDSTDDKQQSGNQRRGQEADGAVHHELGGAQRRADGANAPSGDDDRQNTGHLLDAADPRIHHLSEGHDLLDDDHDGKHDGRQHIARGQCNTDLGAGDILAGEAPADEHDENGNEHHQQGDDHLPRRGLVGVLGLDDGLVGLQLSGGGTILQSVGLEFGHGAEVPLTQCDEGDQHQRQNSIELVGDGLYKGTGIAGLDAQIFKLRGDDAHDVHAPAGNGDQDAHRGGGGVQNVGQLGTGNPQPVEDGAEDGPQDQAVAGVGEEDRQSAQPSRGLGRAAAVDLVGYGRRKGFGSSRSLDECHEATHKGHHDDGLCVGRAGHVHKQVIAEHDLHGIPGVPASSDETAYKQASHQRNDDVLRPECENDRQYCRDQ